MPTQEGDLAIDYDDLSMVAEVYLEAIQACPPGRESMNLYATAFQGVHIPAG